MELLIAFTIYTFSYLVRLSSEFELWLFVNTLDDSLVLRLTLLVCL